MSRYRIPGKGRVDHAAPVRFSLDGRSYTGLRGDTVASALLANGVHLMGRSFKHHRPRGAVTAGSEEPNALIGNMQKLRAGLVAESQNKWPGLGFDLGAVNDLAYPLFSAGFYYKTFMWPRAFWDRLYEPVIRAAAGLGRAPGEPDPDRYASRYLHADLLVVGAGPAGQAAARAGLRVMLAQGAIEKPLVFDGNDRPGVMLAGAAQTYLHRFGVLVGKRAAVVTSHDNAYFAAFDLADAGTRIAVLVDTREAPPADLLDQARSRGIEVLAGHSVTATAGRLRVRSVRVNRVKDGQVAGGQPIACDCLLMSGGWTPSLHLFSHTKGSLIWDAAAQTYLPGETIEECHVAGAGKGLWGCGAVLADGDAAGVAAARALGHAASEAAPQAAHDRTGSGEALRELPSDLAPGLARAFVDFQNDVTAKDIRLAVREGMKSIEHVKRYTTTGMATDQGKLANINGLMIAADTLGKAPPQVGLTTFRPPYTPTTFGALAGYHRGSHFEVTRKTPIDPWPEEQGAVFEPVAQWRRAWYFPRPGEGISADAFPHMSVAECRVAGIPARLFRLSFTGEPGFEINVPARYGLDLWRALIAAGAPFDICPYGTETMHVLRAEKGFIIVGQDTDGTVTPADAGLGHRQGQARFRGQTLAVPARHGGAGARGAHAVRQRDRGALARRPRGVPHGCLALLRPACPHLAGDRARGTCRRSVSARAESPGDAGKRAAHGRVDACAGRAPCPARFAITPAYPLRSARP